MKALHYGDNLQVLRDEIAPESVDLIYLDPPFNSNANYNLQFRSPAGVNFGLAWCPRDTGSVASVGPRPHA